MEQQEYYAAILDGDVESADLRETLQQAQQDAEWMRKHPARLDRKRFGLGGNIAICKVIRCEWTGELIVAETEDCKQD